MSRLLIRISTLSSKPPMRDRDFVDEGQKLRYPGHPPARQLSRASIASNIEHAILRSKIRSSSRIPVGLVTLISVR